MDRKDYGSLRNETHQAALDALSNHVDQVPQQTQEVQDTDREPTRPQEVYRQAQSWPMDQRMESQNGAATAMAQDRQEHLAAKAALDQHIDAGEVSLSPGQSLGRPGDIER